MPGKEKSKKESKRSNPLGEDIQSERFASFKGSNKYNDKEEAGMQVDGAGYLIPNSATKRILRTAKKQLEDIQDDLLMEEEGDLQQRDEGLEDLLGTEEMSMEERERRYEANFSRASRFRANEEHNNNNNEDEEDEDDVELEYDDNESVTSEMPSEMGMGLAVSGDAAAAMYGIDDEEARLLQAFQPPSRVQSRNLADMIMEKIREKEQGQRAAAVNEEDDLRSEEGSLRDAEDRIDPRVARVYTAIGSVLKRYKSGKIPKAFKILPNVRNWEQLLMLTKPDQWSPHATYQATRIFAANLNENMAQRFYAAVLLPVVHEHLLEEKKLHPALYMAVRKALFKPIAFFKGFLLPLATDEECTLREALIVASVLQRSHLPPVPTAVTIVKIAQQPFSGPCSVFLRVLIDKKMALPYQAVDALVGYFHRFLRTHTKEEPLPVLWHQTLLSFTQHYKADLSEEQLALLSSVCNVHFHYMITPEIRREIAAALRTKKE